MKSQTNMENNVPGLMFMNITSGILFILSLMFHKASAQMATINIGGVYDIIYKILALASVLMVITINAPKFNQQIKKASKYIKAFISRKPK